MFYVYAIQSQKDNRIYVGMTGNVDRRINEHNAGKNQSTAFYKPWRLIYVEQIATRPDARKREIWLKSGIGKEYLKKWLRSSTDRIDVS